jgi:hypothetical protein
MGRIDVAYRLFDQVCGYAKFGYYGVVLMICLVALELKQVFDQIAEAEKAGVSAEEKKKLEEQAAEKVRHPNIFRIWSHRSSLYLP